MELYLLDRSFRRSITVDVYESLIWTERFAAVGDFELVIDAEFIPKELTVEGTYIGLSESQRVMIVETSERITEDDGTYKIKITGQSLESVLKHRMNVVLAGDGSQPVPESVEFNWPFEVSAADLLYSILVYNETVPYDLLPNLMLGPLNPPGSLPFPVEPVGTKLIREVEPLGDSIEAICSTFGLGYALVKDGDTGKLYFEFYTGDDRTSGQGERDAVIFSKSMDNLSKTNEIRSIASLKTVAYVIGKNGYKIVYPNSEDAILSGVSRRVLVVKAADITLDAGPELDAALEIRGREELAKASRVHMLDGETSTRNYRYGVDYRLGDLVEQRSISGTSAIFRVVEQIMVSDSEGERSYPTLKMDLLISMDSWFAWPFSSYWDDVNDYWQDV